MTRCPATGKPVSRWHRLTHRHPLYLVGTEPNPAGWLRLCRRGEHTKAVLVIPGDGEGVVVLVEPTSVTERALHMAPNPQALRGFAEAIQSVAPTVVGVS